MATKITIKKSTDGELIDKCKSEIGDCRSISWTYPPKGTRISPPEHTVAVVVDLTDSQGALRIFETETDKFVSMVGMEETGKQILVPWDSNWWLRISGQLHIGYLKNNGE